MTRRGYHTQEKRDTDLREPIPCVKDNAWLGEAVYYWYYADDAYEWGKRSKQRTGQFQIYGSEIDCSNFLDTVFNEEHYIFWVKAIEKSVKAWMKKAGEKPSLQELNSFLFEKGIYSEVDGVMFQDISKNPNLYLVKGMQYRKRIQMAVYNHNRILTFELINNYEI